MASQLAGNSASVGRSVCTRCAIAVGWVRGTRFPPNSETASNIRLAATQAATGGLERTRHGRGRTVGGGGVGALPDDLLVDDTGVWYAPFANHGFANSRQIAARNKHTNSAL